MPTILLTAFEPYDRWQANSSWLCLVELTKELSELPAVTTRLYPVDFTTTRERLAADYERNYDYAIHLGQAPGTGVVQLETFGLNVGGELAQAADEFQPLCPDGPAAYRSTLPLADWARRLRHAGIPAAVSYHAGTYLCNATLYWAHDLVARRHLRTRPAFIHLPLETSQVTAASLAMPTLPAAVTARALRIILETLGTLASDMV